MSCHFEKCNAPAALICGACNRTAWCSIAHQTADWKSGRHRGVCATRQIGVLMGVPALENLFSLYETPTWTLELERLNQLYILSYIGQGVHGVVFRALPRDRTQINIVVKLTWGNAPEILREVHISNLLTILYADMGLDSTVITPIVKTYDYGTGHWSAGDLADFFLVHGAKNGPAYLYLQQQKRTDVLNCAAIISAFVPGESLRAHLYDDSTPIAKYEQFLLNALLQFLLVIYSLNTVLRFNHMDALTSNVLIEPTSRVVLHTTVASDTAYNVETQFILKLADFGESRLDYSGPHGYGLVHPVATPYKQQVPNLPAYRPWADLILLALSILIDISEERLRELSGPRPVWTVLHSMLNLTVDPKRTGSAELIAVRDFLRDKVMTPNAYFSSGEHSTMIRAAVEASTFIFFPTAELLDAEQVLRANHDAFRFALDYKPTVTDIIHDFTLHVGSGGPATKAAWRALSTYKRDVTQVETPAEPKPRRPPPSTFLSSPRYVSSSKSVVP